MRNPFRILLAFILCAGLISSASAAELYGKKFKDKFEVKSTAFELKGLGLKTYFMIRVFVAGLYLGEGVKTTDALKDVPKRLEVAYFIKIPGKKLAVETRRRIKLNTTPEEYKKIKNRVDVMDGFFVDLKAGDRYILTYVPSVGTSFSYNDKTVGTIKGADFARALFAIWLGQNPISPALKDKLLGID